MVGVPLLDLVLLAATVLDLRAGSTATFVHGLAAAYIGFSVAFGRSIRATELLAPGMSGWNGEKPSSGG